MKNTISIELFQPDKNQGAKDIKNASQRARSYLSSFCLHYGEVKNIPREETGIIIGLIVYFMAKEPNITIIKLEAYVLLLNVICSRLYGTAFFKCGLTSSGRIGNFKAFINHMKEKELIRIGDNNRYCLLKKATWLIQNTPRIFMGIQNILIAILKNCGHLNGKQTLEYTLPLEGYPVLQNPKYKDIVHILTEDMKRRAREYEDIIDAEVSYDSNDNGH